MRSPENTQHVEGGYVRPSFMIGLPSLGTVSMKFCMAFNRLQIPVNSATTALYVERMEVGVARNFIAQEYMKADPRPKYLFFLGDDMLPSWDALIRLWDEMEKGTWDVLSALYYLKLEPPSPLIRRINVPGALVPGVHFKVGEVVDCDSTGMDFCLIKPEVFENITYPYFKTGYDYTPIDQNGNGNVLQYTEDSYFLRKVREAKMRIGVHTGVRVSHYDNKTGMIF